jgi:hypothetical protein
MAAIATRARARIARMQEEEGTLGAKSRSQKYKWRRRGAAAFGEGKCEKVADPCGACL